MADIKFVDGLLVKAPNPAAPDFVKCTISIKRAELGNWLRAQEGEWINVQVKEAKSGKWYAAVDEWKPSQAASPAPKKTEEFDDDLDIPF